MRHSRRERIVVIGAGMAGLAAAHELHSRGFDVAVIEARGRPGGRIHTDRSLRVPVELGAASIEIQGCNPLSRLARQWHVETRPIDYASLAVYDAEGGRFDEQEVEAAVDRLEQLITARWRQSRRAAAKTRANRASVQDALDPRVFATWPDTRAGRLRGWAMSVHVCEYGAELGDLSLSDFDDGFDDDWDDLLVLGGLDRIIAQLAAGLDVRLRHEVRRIEVRDAQVRVVCDQGAIEAERAVVTLPLGVLKTGQVEFDPPLPEGKLAAIERLSMGQVEKVALEFAEPFWPAEVDFLGYASRTPGEFPQFLSLLRATGQPILLATTAGDHARQLGRLSEEEVVTRLRWALDSMFGSPTPPPSAVRITRWGRDPFSLGAYSYVPVAACGEDHDVLAESVNERLFFAGEATCRQYPSTAHGAYLSGLRAAERIAAG